jgi:hypothetical protein
LTRLARILLTLLLAVSANASAIVDDNGNEVLRKSAEVITPRTVYFLRTGIFDQAGDSLDVNPDGTIDVATGIVISALNSSTAAIASSGSFTGVGEDIRRYQEISLNLAGAPSVAAGTLYFEFSPDFANCATATHWDVSVPIALTGPNTLVPQPLRAVLPCFRVRYENGATALTEFRLTSTLHHTSSKHLTRFLNQAIGDGEPVENVRAIVGGRSPDGPYINLPASGTVAAQSTMATLTAGSTFSGAITDTTGFVACAITVKSDVNSAANGVVFQWFADLAGTQLLKESTFTYGSSPNGIGIQVPTQGPYMRVKYTNGGTNQTTFTLLTRLITTAPPSDVLAISETITDNTAAQIVKAQLVGKQENGVFNNVRLSNSASIKVAVTDRPSEVRSRVYVKKFITGAALVAAPGTTIHTVTGGTIFYLTSFILSTINASVGTNGQWTLQDGTDTTDRIPFITSQASAGSPSQAATASPSLPEPIAFGTDVRAIELAGDITASITIIGYEE